MKKMLDKSGKTEYNEIKWYRCTECGKKLLVLAPETRIEHLMYKCKSCGSVIEITVP